MLSTILSSVNSLMTGVTCSIGAHEIARNESPPRLVWVPTEDQFDSPLSQGQLYHSLRTRRAGVEGHIWGISYAQAEAMLHNLVRALYRTAGGPSIRIGAVRWLAAETIDLGYCCVLPVTIDIPVLDTAVTMPTAPATEASQPAAATNVTVVASAPAAGEAVMADGTLDFDKPTT